MYFYKQAQNGEIISVEAKNRDSASPDFVKATKAEYDKFTADLPISPPPLPPRNLAAEFDELKTKLVKEGVIRRYKV